VCLTLPTRARVARLADGLAAALPAWLVAHLFVLALCARIDPGRPLAPLSTWDTHWYLTEVDGMVHGGPVFTDPTTGPGGLAHFFPLTSLGAAGVALVTRLPADVALFAFCWVLALVFGALVHVLAVRETGNATTAFRAACLSQLAPGAFVLVMGYTEALAGVLAVLYFLCVRARRPGWAFAVGLLAGVSRPTGIVLALPGLIEAIRAARDEGWAPRALYAAVAQTAAPFLGLFGYLGYCQLRFGDWVLPYAQQVTDGNRGGVTQNPVASIRILLSVHEPAVLFTSLACAAIGLAAMYACWRRMPVSYTAWSAVMFVLGVTSPWFTSEPRYLAAIFPLLIALPLALRTNWAWYTFLVADLLLLYWVGYLALTWQQVA
jgi:hypothetical protein